MRKPFQGIWNIIRFNWHFYLLSFSLVLLITLISQVLSKPYTIVGNIICLLVIAITTVSLIVSFYIYDISGLYKLNWLPALTFSPNSKIANVHAGFDETSILLSNKYPRVELTVFDFYDPVKHTEVSIKRARKAYPPFPCTQQIEFSQIPLPGNYFDCIFIIFSAHEIRKEGERDIFFTELNRILKPKGHIIVIEHLRDIPNFLAYNIGFFHFIKRSSWYSTFKAADLIVHRTKKITPFITTFILKKNGTAS